MVGRFLRVTEVVWLEEVGAVPVVLGRVGVVVVEGAQSLGEVVLLPRDRTTIRSESNAYRAD